MRPLCECKERPRAVNYKKNGKTFYRRFCEKCNRRGQVLLAPRWKRAGYQVKKFCEKCGAQSQHPEIFRVFHIDGNLNNCRYSNLKTVCLNCTMILSKEGIMWKQGDLTADY